MDSLKTMLIVDDMETSKNLLYKIFKGDYIIEAADNGNSAINILKEKIIDVVILNIMTTTINGQAILKEIKKNGTLKKIPIIVEITEAEKQKQKALQMGADDFIVMPYDKIIVKNRVDNIVKRYKYAKEINEKLEKTQYNLDEIITAIPGGVIMFKFSADKFVTAFFNNGFCKLTGYSRTEYSNFSKEDILKIVYLEDRNKVILKIASLEKNREIIPLTFRINHKTKGKKWVFANLVRHVDTKGETNYRCVLIDISSEKESQLETKRVNKQLAYIVDHDDLTGIYNQSGFFNATEKLLKENPEKEYSLICSNVEDFKVINDLYGIEYGDGVLCSLASYCLKMSNGIGTCGRLGNDHFAVCIPRGVYYMNMLESVATMKFNIHGIDIPLVCNFGIYNIFESDIPINIMCDRANIALQTIKKKYKKNCVVFEDEMRQKILYDQKITSETVDAIKNEQFIVYFQPIYSFSEGKFIGAEALTRWIHPIKGIIQPGKFIPVLEKNGAICELDKYVWEKVCNQINEWKSKDIEVLPISLNASPLHLSDPNFADDFLSMLKTKNINTELIRLELTESAYILNSDHIQDVIYKLQSNGIKILMDDFGSEYSSFNMLKDLNIDIIKLDMRFMRDFETVPRGKTILAGIVRMAKWLNLPIIAEGVETKEQSDFLQSVGCSYIQGFYYSKPLAPIDFEILLGNKEQIVMPNQELNFYDFDMDKLMDSDPRVELIWNNILVGMGIYEMHGDKVELVRANKCYYEMMGIIPDSLSSIQKNIVNFILEEDRQIFLQACINASLNSSPENIQVRRICSCGKIINILIKMRCLGYSGEDTELCFTVLELSNNQITL